jgi:hypothetical protein
VKRADSVLDDSKAGFVPAVKSPDGRDFTGSWVGLGVLMILGGLQRLRRIHVEKGNDAFPGSPE